MEHGEKIVDGVVLKYVCQPCPECEGKLTAAEEMARVCQAIKDHADLNMALAPGAPKPLYNELEAALSAWEKTGRGKP